MSANRFTRVRFLASRTAQTLLVLVIITFVTFAVFSLWPSDPAALACGKPCTPENLERARTFMGFDEPWYAQFWSYLVGIVQGRTFGTGAGALTCARGRRGFSTCQSRSWRSGAARGRFASSTCRPSRSGWR